MANGSNRSSPTLPAAAAVFSELMIEPRNTPCLQSNDSVTRGTLVARRPPNRMAEIGTPLGSSHSGAIDGHCDAGVVNRALGWAAGASDAGVQSLSRQSIAWGGGDDRPSHQTSPSSVRATLVKIELPDSVATALGLVSSPVPGATPKNPASGLMACKRPSASGLIQAMSSPTVHTFQPSNPAGGISMAKL